MDDTPRYVPPSELVAERLVELLGKANAGEIVSIAYVCTLPNGDYVSNECGDISRLKRSGMYLDLAIGALGYQTREDVYTDKEG